MAKTPPASLLAPQGGFSCRFAAIHLLLSPAGQRPRGAAFTRKARLGATGDTCATEHVRALGPLIGSNPRERADVGSAARRPPFGAQPPHSGGTWRGDRPLRVHNARLPASSQTPVHSVRLFGEHPFSSVARPFPDKPACAGPCPGSLLGAGVRSAARSSPRPRSGPSALRITAQRLNALTLRGLRDAVTAHHSAKNAVPPSASPVFFACAV